MELGTRGGHRRNWRTKIDVFVASDAAVLRESHAFRTGSDPGRIGPDPVSTMVISAGNMVLAVFFMDVTSISQHVKKTRKKSAQLRLVKASKCR